jgi:hypothetical protein
MKYATVKDVIASFPRPILPTVQGKPDYQTIHDIRKLLKADSRTTDTHLGGGTLGHLGLIVSDASYAMIAPATVAGPPLWVSPTALGRALAIIDGTTFMNYVAQECKSITCTKPCSALQNLPFYRRSKMLIPQVRLAHKYPISPWEMIHLPVRDNALCVPPYKVYTTVRKKSLTDTYQCKTQIPSNKVLVNNN